MRGLSFIVDGELFVVDVTLVRKVARRMTVTSIFTAPDAVVGIANMKGSVVTLLSLFELLGRKQSGKDRIAKTVDAVIFKSFSHSEDQMGLIIDKPGGLIDIDENSIRPPAPATGAEENLCISGLADIDDRLYRIISIDAISRRFDQYGE
jgi:purine-binding chemotaxis protein CheW